jgi:Sigma-70, region 4
MARKSLPAKLCKSGPGTGGRNWNRDAEIFALKARTNMSNEEIGKKYKMSRERVRQILSTGERNVKQGITRWMSARERREKAVRDGIMPASVLGSS